MRGRTPEWLSQVVDGLGDGKTWLVATYRGLPAPIRAGGWLLLQAILFKLQPELWNGFRTVAEMVGAVTALHVRTQLLLVVLLLLSGHAAFVVPKLNSLHDVVENMDSSTRGAGETVADGGSPANRRSDDDLSPSGAGAISGAVAGGAVGILWGPATIIGLAVLGAMIGDEWEQRVLDG